ncbi:retrovirus-related pol polyprotein from transposon TNT 1-94 [Tanacetum coccineum]
MSEPIRVAVVKQSLGLNANTRDLMMSTCKKCIFNDIHDMCLLDFVKNMNGRSKSAKKLKKQNVLETYGITTTKIVPIKEEKESTPVLLKCSSKHVKIVKSKNANNSEPNHTWGSNATDIPSSYSLVNGRSSIFSSGTVRFENDQIVRIMGYGDYQLTKDEAHEAIIKCIKNIQVCLNATVRNVRIDNRTEFVNQTLRDFYENVGISHQTSVSRTPQQNGVVKRRNRTLIEAARTMLIFSKALLFLWAEAINTACYTQNRSLIHQRYNKTPYELMQENKPDLSFLHVFGSLCYPTNDNEDLGKLDAKADIGLGLHSMTPTTSSTGLGSNPFKKDATLRAVDLADSLVSTSIDQDAPSQMYLHQVKMDDLNVTMEEYIRLEEEKARRRGKVYNWETATHGKIWDNEDVHGLGSVETEFPAIVFNDMLTSEAALSCKPMVSSLNKDEIDFRISLDESDDEDCTDLVKEISTNIGGEFSNLEDLEVLES